MTLIDLANSPHLDDEHRLAIAAHLRAQGIDQLGRRTDRAGRRAIRAGIPPSHPRNDGDDDDDDGGDDDTDDDSDDDTDDDPGTRRRAAKKPAARRRRSGSGDDDNDDNGDDDNGDEETDAQKATRLERELAQERRRRERLERRSKAKRPARQRDQQQTEEQEQELATARGRGDRLANRLVTQERDAVITKIASRLRFEDPADAVDYLTRPGRLPDNVAELVEEDGADVEVDVDESAIEAALKKLAKAKPKWLKDAGTQQSRDAGRGDRVRRRNSSNGDGTADSDFDPRGRLARAYAGNGG
jgi:hypothetical protein